MARGYMWICICIAVFLPIRLLASEPEAPKTKTVEAVGKGKSMDEAKRNAMCIAVEQVVGVLVDAETVVKNEDLIQNEILTYSAGYIEKCEVLKSAEVNGVFGVRIRATVVAEKLRDALRKRKIVSESLDGQSLYAQIATQNRAEKDFRAIFQNLFESKYDLTKLLRPHMESMEVLSRSENDTHIQFTVSLVADEVAASNFYNEVKSLLDSKWRGVKSHGQWCPDINCFSESESVRYVRLIRTINPSGKWQGYDYPGDDSNDYLGDELQYIIKYFDSLTERKIVVVGILRDNKGEKIGSTGLRLTSHYARGDCRFYGVHEHDGSMLLYPWALSKGAYPFTVDLHLPLSDVDRIDRIDWHFMRLNNDSRSDGIFYHVKSALRNIVHFIARIIVFLWHKIFP